MAGLIVWGGLSAALGAIEALFDIDVSWRWYQYFGAFSLIFLAGSFMLNHYTFSLLALPKDENSDFVLGNSRVRKVFGSYIFLPLALLYLAIFSAYGIKILITGMRPKGIIVWLGTGYFARGILTYYFTFLEQTKFFHWIRRILFVSFILVACMMLGALGLRVQQYGISINRYFVALFILFMICFSVSAFFFSKIRLRIFISLLFGLSLIALYGPLSARNVAFFAQKLHIELLLLKENIYLPLQKDALKNLTGTTAEQLSETISDFVHTFPYEQWNRELFNGQYSEKENAWSYGYDVRSYLGAQEYYGEWDREEGSKEINFRIGISYDSFEKMGIEISDYRKLYEMHWLNARIENNSFLYSISGENKFLDLKPYLEDIYKQSLKGEEKRYNES